MTATDDFDTDDGPTRPPWAVPLAIAVVAVLAIAAALIFGGGDDDPPTASSLPPVTTTDTTAATSVPENTTDTTVATPTTTAASTTTTVAPPATAPPATQPPPQGPIADDVGSLAPGEASIADASGSQRFTMVSTCLSTQTVGLQVVSSLLVGANGSIRTLDVFLDEGASPMIELSDLDGQIPGFVFGRDGGDDGQVRWGGAGPSGSIDPANQLTLASIGAGQRGDGSAVGAVNISYRPADVGVCGTGFVSEPWPFGPGEQATFVDQFGPTIGRGFSVLGECSGSLILSEGGLLTSFDTPDGISATLQRAPGGAALENWATPFTIDPLEQVVQQQGGGGDVTTALRIDRFDNGAAYLEWTQQPTVPGGLVSIECG